MNDENVQLCILLFNSATSTYRQLTELSKTLHTDQPEVQQIVELTILNKKAWRELESYNSEQKFIYEHPLISSNKLKHSLNTLIKTDQAEFLSLPYLRQKSIDKYNSIYRNSKKTKEERLNAIEHILRLREELVLIEQILRDNLH